MNTLAIVDDHDLYRRTFTCLIKRHSDIKVIMEAESGSDIIEILHDSTTYPEVLFVNANMANGFNGIETTSIIHTYYPFIKIIGLSFLYQEQVIIQMLRKGATGFLCKGIDDEILMQAINSVIRDEIFVAGWDIKKRLYNWNICPNPLNHQKNNGHIHLTGKQILFLQFCCTELTYEQIANLMDISPHTANRYREELCRKLSAHTRVGLAIYAMQSGLME